MSNNCSNYIYGCSFDESPEQKDTLIIVLVILFASTLMLLINLVVLILYTKFNKEPWKFDHYCIFMLFLMQIIASLYNYINIYSKCDEQIEKNNFICLFRSCFYFFILVILSKYNFMIASERFASVTFSNLLKHKLKKKFNLKISVLIDLIANLILFTLLMLPFILNSVHKDGCYCDANIQLSPSFIISVCSIVLIFIFSTIIIYMYIYRYVFKKISKIETETTFDTSLKERRKSKINIIIQNSADLFNKTKRISKLR
jgi:hypothetical protein